MEVKEDFDISELHQEAQHRWLKPAEVYFLLQNYERQQLPAETPQNPQSGSLFLFNRRVLRFFRKDGHLWRKKKGSKTVGEAHERLKVGNVDTLNCYYAHGEKNPNFQRRSYWILDPAWEHIVLVHYRDVNELQSDASQGRHNTRSTILLSPDSSSLYSQSALVHSAPNVYEQNSFSPGLSVEEVSSRYPPENCEIQHFGMLDGGGMDFVTPTGQVNQALRRLVEQLSFDDANAIGIPEKLSPYPLLPEKPLDSGFLVGHEASIYGMKPNGLNSTALSEQPDDKVKLQDPEAGNGLWKEVLEKCSPSSGLDAFQIQSVKDQDEPDLFVGEQHSDESKHFSRQLSAARRFLLDSDDAIGPPISSQLIHEVENSLTSTYSSEASTHESGLSMLQKTDSIEWMEKRSMDIGNSNQKSSPNFFVMSFDEHRFGTTLLEPSLTIAEVQRFSIQDVSPEWAYCTDRAKVLIVGDFLYNSSSSSWACMFGDIEVPAEIVRNGVLRCYAPQHSAGMVPLFITARNREACSEIKEFEFRFKEESFPPSGISQSNVLRQTDDELILVIRLAEILLFGTDSFSLRKENCLESGGEVSKCPIMGNSSWNDIVEAILGGIRSPQKTMGWVLDELLKDKLHHWLLSKSQQSNGGDPAGCSLSKQEQGVIHLISALGYDWGLLPILKAGVGVNFRDMNGWTALHWAARYGREKMVAALVASGASAGAVTDPTSLEPSGKNPASIAAECGHKGLAGYLSELALTTHLNLLKPEESEISKGSAAVEAERTVEIVSDKSKQVIASDFEDQLSLKDSLAAVRNAAQAAARIQAAFRVHSFRKRQQIAALNWDDYGMTPDCISALSKLQRAVWNSPDHNHKINKAALSIQKNYRGWKRRKEYLNLRRNVVKIQALVRGHQVRKKYKEFLWTVGVVEKAILRWRRKGAGLRGFKPEFETIDEGEEDDDILKVFRKQKVDATIEKAVSRVLSMVDTPDARQQYSRMLETYQQTKAELADNPSEIASSSLDNGRYMDEEDDLYFDIGTPLLYK